MAEEIYGRGKNHNAHALQAELRSHLHQIG